jgi:hypothetical protein
MTGPDELGRSEGDHLGPEPGKGKVIHTTTGEADFDGLPGDELPPKKDVQESQPYPPDRASD